MRRFHHASTRGLQVPTEREEADGVATASELAEFLAAHHAQAQEAGRWPELRFQLATYLCARLPPLALIGSARAVLLRPGDGTEVMVVRDPGSMHILPGGRRRAGESLERTLRRELLEETGWTVQRPRLLGVRHFHHCQTPDGRPAPEFFQAVFAACADSLHPEQREIGGYELEAAFRPLADVRRLPLPANERLFLHAALRWSGPAGARG